MYIYIYHHPETHARTHAFVPIKLKKNQYIQCIKRMNVLKNAQNPLYFLILQKCSIICMHGSDYCYPSTSLDQDLELGGGLGHRSHTVENCTSHFVPLLLEPGRAESRMGRWNSSRRRGFPPVLPPTLVPAALPRTVIHALRWSQGCL